LLGPVVAEVEGHAFLYGRSTGEAEMEGHQDAADEVVAIDPRVHREVARRQSLLQRGQRTIRCGPFRRRQAPGELSKRQT
jgi:hypothetical protein